MEDFYSEWPIIEEEVGPEEVAVMPIPVNEVPGEVASMPIYEEEAVTNDQAGLLVELHPDGTTVSLLHKEILDELSSIASTIIGHVEYLKMEKFGISFLDKYFPLLLKNLRTLQEKEKIDIDETLEILRRPESNVNDELLKEKVQEFSFLLCLKLDKTQNPIFAEERLLKENLKEIYELLFLKVKKNRTSPLLPPLLSSLSEMLLELKEKSTSTFTLAEVKNEASKIFYLKMRREQKNIPNHPEHINNIPRYWDDEHRDRDTDSLCYPSKQVYASISNYTGLTKKQVGNLFANYRKREAGKDENLVDALNKKKPFAKAVTDVFRKWKADNPLKKIPNEADLLALMRDTGKDETQIINWFYNNAQGREKRNHRKKRSHPEDLTPKSTAHPE